MSDKNEIEELLTIIPKGYPSIEIFHIDDKNIAISKEIERFSKEQGYGYDLEIIGDDRVYDNTTLIYRKFDINKHRYNRHAKLYDYIFITFDLGAVEKIELFLKKLYHICKNGAKVLFITDNQFNIAKLEEILTDLNYVAINKIENTISNYQILGAQKMHGWGS